MASAEGATANEALDALKAQVGKPLEKISRERFRVLEHVLVHDDPEDPGVPRLSFAIPFSDVKGPLEAHEVAGYRRKVRKTQCAGCRVRLSGQIPHPNAKGSFCDQLSSDCKMCAKEATALKEAGDSLAGLSLEMGNELARQVHMYPMWERYRFRGRPDTAVRLLKFRVEFDCYFEDQFLKGKSNVNPTLLAYTYQSFILDHLPDKFKFDPSSSSTSSSSPVPGSIILGYTNPQRLRAFAVELNFLPETIASDGGLNWLWDVDIKKLEVVPGWSKICTERLLKLNRVIFLQWLVPFGYQFLLYLFEHHIGKL